MRLEDTLSSRGEDMFRRRQGDEAVVFVPFC
jgi:hypothetical protein